MKVIYDKQNQKVPIKIWSDIEKVEPAAIKQLQNTASLPFVFKHVAVMPDVHYGMGATVGSVVATKGAICPACVGVDIGCGMMAVKTDLDHKIIQDKISLIRKSIEASVPVGFGQNKEATLSVMNWSGFDNVLNMKNMSAELINKSLLQMGTLGGGNHFIEICLDTENNVWIMLHSGSRGVGNMLARKHIDSAKGLMKKMLIELPDQDLAYLPQHTNEFDDYIKDLQWAQGYALQNRIEMMSRIVKDVSVVIYGELGRIKINNEVNCHHNYVSWENHFGENVMVTRKGAVRAREGDMGIIPGSMGAKSFIVKGLGNPESFNSCSHGAGRKMSRTEAKKRFTLEDLALQTSGVECRKDADVIDEIPSAYKDIDEVMDNQKDLVSIVAQLKQIMCIKG